MKILLLFLSSALPSLGRANGKNNLKFTDFHISVSQHDDDAVVLLCMAVLDHTVQCFVQIPSKFKGPDARPEWGDT